MSIDGSCKLTRHHNLQQYPLSLSPTYTSYSVILCYFSSHKLISVLTLNGGGLFCHD
ncbi:hypothetical protein Hanom_Chr06g00525611 [Helianthus anomalus]